MNGMELLIASICYNATFCDYVYDNPDLDIQLTKKQNETLALKNEINGKHLKIGTYNNYPQSWVENQNGTLVGKGVAFILVDVLRRRFNFTFEVVLPKRNYEYGGNDDNDSLIGLVNSSSVDFGAAFIPILYEYQTKVEFSNGLDEGRWAMMLKRPKESAAGSGLLAPFENQVWFLILAAVLSYGPCITLITHIRSKFLRDDDDQINLTPSFWFVYGAFIKQGTTLAPEANTTRVLFATWWIFIILLSAFYTANLTAFLTLSKFTLDIENPVDLYKKNYRWISNEGGAVQFVVEDVNEDLHYLASMISNGRAEFRPEINDSDYLPLVSGGAVLVKEVTAIDHLMFGDYLRKARQGVLEEDRCTYVVAPNPFMKKTRGFAFPKNSTISRLFNPVLVYLFQAGIVQHLMRRDLPSTKICPLDLQSKDRKLQNSDLLMTYLIMIFGLAAASTAFIVELFIKRYLRDKLINHATKTNKKSRKSFKKGNSDDSLPPPYDSLFGKNSIYKDSGKRERKLVNGREYWVVNTISGDTRLIPVRTPSAFLWNT